MTPNKKKSEICVCGHPKESHKLGMIVAEHIPNLPCTNCDCWNFRPPQADMKDVLQRPVGIGIWACVNCGGDRMYTYSEGDVRQVKKAPYYPCSCPIPQHQNGEEKYHGGNLEEHYQCFKHNGMRDCCGCARRVDCDSRSIYPKQPAKPEVREHKERCHHKDGSKEHVLRNGIKCRCWCFDPPTPEANKVKPGSPENSRGNIGDANYEGSVKGSSTGASIPSSHAPSGEKKCHAACRLADELHGKQPLTQVNESGENWEKQVKAQVDLIVENAKGVVVGISLDFLDALKTGMVSIVSDILSRQTAIHEKEKIEAHERGKLKGYDDHVKLNHVGEQQALASFVARVKDIVLNGTEDRALPTFHQNGIIYVHQEILLHLLDELLKQETK